MRSIVLHDHEVRALEANGAVEVRRPAAIALRSSRGCPLSRVVPSLLPNPGDLFDAQYRLDSPISHRCPFGAPGGSLRRKFSTNILDVVATRAERLHAITDLAAHESGTGLARIQEVRAPSRGPLVDAFANAWDKHYRRRSPWSSNQIVWVARLALVKAPRTTSTFSRTAPPR